MLYILQPAPVQVHCIRTAQAFPAAHPISLLHFLYNTLQPWRTTTTSVWFCQPLVSEITSIWSAHSQQWSPECSSQSCPSLPCPKHCQTSYLYPPALPQTRGHHALACASLLQATTSRVPSSRNWCISVPSNSTSPIVTPLTSQSSHSCTAARALHPWPAVTTPLQSRTSKVVTALCTDLAICC